MTLEDRILDYLAMRGDEKLEFMLDGDEETGYNLMYGKKFNRNRYFDSSDKLIKFYNQKLKPKDDRRDPYMSLVGNANEPLKQHLESLGEDVIANEDLGEWVVDVFQITSSTADALEYGQPGMYAIESDRHPTREELEEIGVKIGENEQNRIKISEQIMIDELAATITQAVAGSEVGEDEVGEYMPYFMQMRYLREDS